MRYIKHELELIVKDSYSIAEVCRKLGIRPVGGNYKTIKQKIKVFSLDTSHFTGQGWRKGATVPVRPCYKLSDILVENSTYASHKLKLRLIKNGLKQHKCENCGNEEWMGKPIPLELEHSNGNNTDNRIENLKLLCPNCHAQTDYYRGRCKKSALSEMKAVEYRKFRETLLTGNPDPSFQLTLDEGAETRHGKSKAKREVIIKKCLHCNNLMELSKNKYCSAKCYKEHNSEHLPKVPEIIEAFRVHKSFVKVGEFFNVSDTAVKKWCLKYGIMDMIKV